MISFLIHLANPSFSPLISSFPSLSLFPSPNYSPHYCLCLWNISLTLIFPLSIPSFPPFPLPSPAIPLTHAFVPETPPTYFPSFCFPLPFTKHSPYPMLFILPPLVSTPFPLFYTPSFPFYTKPFPSLKPPSLPLNLLPFPPFPPLTKVFPYMVPSHSPSPPLSYLPSYLVLCPLYSLLYNPFSSPLQPLSTSSFLLKLHPFIPLSNPFSPLFSVPSLYLSAPLFQPHPYSPP